MAGFSMHQFIVQLYKYCRKTQEEHEGWATASLSRAMVFGRCLCSGNDRPTGTFVRSAVKFWGRDGEEED